MMDDQMKEMRQDSRQHMRMVWELSGLDESQLNDEDRGLLEAMRMHPEYYDLWGRLDEVSDEELERDGSNPVLHITIHQTIENQIAANDPPETARTLARLMKQNQTRHEAVHEIGTVMAEEIYEMMKFKRTFDQQRYVKKLRRLGRPQRKQKRGRRRKS